MSKMSIKSILERVRLSSLSCLVYFEKFIIRLYLMSVIIIRTIDVTETKF
jgi:hypothetical protein